MDAEVDVHWLSIRRASRAQLEHPDSRDNDAGCVSLTNIRSHERLLFRTCEHLCLTYNSSISRAALVSQMRAFVSHAHSCLTHDYCTAHP